MNALRDYHVHTTFSDGTNTPEEVVLEAVSRGLEEIGFSDHSYTPFDGSYCIQKGDVPKYTAEIRRLQEKYRGQITVRLGVEQDLYAGAPAAGYDYVIGSCHYFCLEEKDLGYAEKDLAAVLKAAPEGACIRDGGRLFIPVDYRKDILVWAADTFFQGDVYPLIENYYEALKTLVLKTDCDLIGHFDLVTKFNEDHALFDPSDSLYRKSWQGAAVALLAAGKPFEINTGGVARGYRTEPYPAKEIRAYLKERGASFVLSSDSHARGSLCYGFTEALEAECSPFSPAGKPVNAVLSGNLYPGRGILIGETEDGQSAVLAYFLMGRSAHSKNRVLVEQSGSVFTEAVDLQKVVDPSLILYAAVRPFGQEIIVTNGDQTDTVFQGLSEGKTLEEALESRTFEPDAPHYTPRISGLLSRRDGGLQYRLSVLKRDEAGDTARHFYEYTGKPGLGHLIHTYLGDGNPLPSFTGSPRRVRIEGDLDAFSEALWNALNKNNRIALYVRFTDLKTGAAKARVFNTSAPEER